MPDRPETDALTTLPAIADEAARRGGCDDGVAWGRAHDLADVAEQMRPDWALWVLLNLSDAISPDVTRHFAQAASRTPSSRLRLICSGYVPATDDTLAALEATLLRRPRSLALSLRESFPDAPAPIVAILERVIARQVTQTNPGVAGHEHDDLSVRRGR